MAETGRKIALGVGIYAIVKAVLNLILGFSAGNVITLVVAGVIFVLLFQRVPYTNYVIAVYFALLFLAYFWGNVTNLTTSWVYTLYLIEGILDLAAGALLAFHKGVKAYYQQ
jgi:hypothetical protein